MQNNNQLLIYLREKSIRMRRFALEAALAAGSNSSHIGPGLSIVDISATLYGAVMRHDPDNPEWPQRDRLILSKGHGVLGYYSALVEEGYINSSELKDFEKDGSDLLGHPVCNRPKGIEFSTGSLGMGLSLGVGVALAGRRHQMDFRVFVIVGDGECNEGAIWEAAMSAAHYGLDKLVVIVDRNGWQQTGTNAEIMTVEDLGSKWRSFGWETRELDGHDFVALYHSFTTPPAVGKPLAVLARTVKGKGFSFSEDNNNFHHAILTKELYEQALSELQYE